MQTMWHDVTLAARFLRKNPGFTLAATLTLALGIGANATVFSFANAVLFRTLPVPDGDRIVHVYQRRADEGPYPVSLPDYFDYRDNTRSFDVLAAHYPTSPMHVMFNGEPAALSGAVVTASYFDVLRITPAAGRFFTGEEDRVRDRDAVAVIGHGLWQRQFGGEHSAVGGHVNINGRVFTIIGVAPQGFNGVQPGWVQTDIWIPSAMFGVGYRYCDAFTRSCTIVNLLGRVRAGVTFKEAQRELDVLARQLEVAYPATNKGTGVTIVPARGLGRNDVSEARQVSLFVAVVAVVLLIGCANIAGLLLARAAGRRREIAIRLALGAGRRRIVRQLLTESLLIGALGGGIGLMCAFWGNAILDSLYSTDNAGRPVDFHVAVSASVVLATMALTAGAAIVFGMIPALQASRADVIAVLKDEGASGGAARARLRQLLVTGQVALSVMLLIGAGLLIRSVNSLYQGPGFDPDHVVLMRLRPSLIGYSFERAAEYQRQVVSRLEATPGVVSASPCVFLPLMGAGVFVDVAPIGQDSAERTRAIGGNVGPRYFATIGLALIDGREFSEQDVAGAPPVAIINDVLARKMWGTESGIGRPLTINGREHLVVGVVPDAEYYAAGEPRNAQVFLSYWQSGNRDAFLKDARMHVRVAGDARAILPQLRRIVAAVDPAVPISEDYPLADRVAFAYQRVRSARSLLVSVAALALVLSAVGLYGVLARTMHQRTREVGVRMALGASRRQIAALALRDALAMSATGTVLGIAAAWGASRWLASLLYGVDRFDAVTFAIAPLLLLAVAAIATVIPARRAARVSPLTALRYE